MSSSVPPAPSPSWRFLASCWSTSGTRAGGEHLGYLFTGLWTILAGIAMTQSTEVAGVIGVTGIIVGPVLMLCSLEFVGRRGDHGWKLAETLTPIAYVTWSLWLAGTGIAPLT